MDNSPRIIDPNNVLTMDFLEVFCMYLYISLFLLLLVESIQNYVEMFLVKLEILNVWKQYQ